MLICRTPFRLSFYGGGLDYPEWYNNNPCRVLTASLGHYCYQTVRKLPPFFEHKFRAAYSTIETVKDFNDIKHPSIRECIKHYCPDKSIEITHVGDLPARSGIGSSSSFTVGLVNSFNAMNGKILSKRNLALEAINIEQNFIKETVGFQDQCAAAFGGLTLIDADSNGIRPRKFIVRKDYIDYIMDGLLLGFNGTHRFSGTAAQKTSSSIKSSKYDHLLNELSDLSLSGISAFSNEADLNHHAAITSEARNIKKVLNGDNDSSDINDLIECTEKAGSLCTRVMGAGGGGFVLCWAPKHLHQKIKDSVRFKTWVDVKLSPNGSEIIYYE